MCTNLSRGEQPPAQSEVIEQRTVTTVMARAAIIICALLVCSGLCVPSSSSKVRSRPARRPKPKRPEADLDPRPRVLAKGEDDTAEEADGDAAASTSTVEVDERSAEATAEDGSESPRKTSRQAKTKRKLKRRRRTAPPPPPGVSGWLSSYIDSAKQSLAERRERAERERLVRELQLQQLREEFERRMQQAEAEGADVDVDDGPVEVSMVERGMLYGSVLMSPAGVPGLIVGGAMGGTAGFVADRIERVRSYISDAYCERVDTEQQNAAQMAAASSELQNLDEVTVKSADPEEAAELAAALKDFLCRPCNQRCADCAARLEARNQAWASVNLAVLVCFDCAAVHRSLGVSGAYRAARRPPPAAHRPPPTAHRPAHKPLTRLAPLLFTPSPLFTHAPHASRPSPLEQSRVSSLSYSTGGTWRRRRCCSRAATTWRGSCTCRGCHAATQSLPPRATPRSGRPSYAPSTSGCAGRSRRSARGASTRSRARGGRRASRPRRAPSGSARPPPARGARGPLVPGRCLA